MAGRQEQLGKRISKRLSDLVRESRITSVDQHTTTAHFLLSIPNLWTTLTIRLVGFGGCWGGGVWKGIRKDSLSILLNALYIFLLRTEVSSVQQGLIKFLTRIPIVFFQLCYYLPPSLLGLLFHFPGPEPGLCVPAASASIYLTTATVCVQLSLSEKSSYGVYTPIQLQSPKILECKDGARLLRVSNPEVFKLFYGGVLYTVKLFIQNKSYSATIYKRSETGEAQGEIVGKYSFIRPPGFLRP